MKKVTFQFLSSTHSGTQHMLALDGTIMNGRQGCFCKRKKRNGIIHLSSFSNRYMRKEICGGCSGHEATKGVCEWTCCFMLQGTAKERLQKIFLVWMNGPVYIMHVGVSCLIRGNTSQCSASLNSDSWCLSHKNIQENQQIRLKCHANLNPDSSFLCDKLLSCVFWKSWGGFHGRQHWNTVEATLRPTFMSSF